MPASAAGSRIHWPAVVLLTVAHQIIPMIWYALFAAAWMQGWHLTQADVASPHPLPYVFSLVGALGANAFLSWLFARLGISTAGEGALMALLLWAVFVLRALLVHYSFGMPQHFPANLGVVAIDSGMELVLLVLSGVVLARWRRA